MKRFFFALGLCLSVRMVMPVFGGCVDELSELAYQQAETKIRDALGESWVAAEKSLAMQVFYFSDELQTYGATLFRLSRPALESVKDIKMVDRSEKFSDFYTQLIDALFERDMTLAISYRNWTKKIKRLYIVKWAENSAAGKTDLKREDLKAIIERNPWDDLEKLKALVPSNAKLIQAPKSKDEVRDDSVEDDMPEELDEVAFKNLKSAASLMAKQAAGLKEVFDDLHELDPSMEFEYSIPQWIDFFKSYRNLLSSFELLYNKYQFFDNEEVSLVFNELAKKIDMVSDKVISKYKSIDPGSDASEYNESLDRFDVLLSLLQSLEGLK